MVDSGSVRRESQDAVLHELELLDDTVAQDASGWGAITVARAPREACDGKPGLHDLALLGDTVAQYASGRVRSL